MGEAYGSGGGAYCLSQTFHVGGEGGWDYLTVDPEHKLLYVPRTTHTMVLDAATGKTVADIPGQQHNHGVALVPSVGRGFISDGQDASVTIFDLKTNQVLGKIKADVDADGIIYDPASRKVLVVCGDAGVLIPISPDVDPQTGKADAAVALGGKPEFLVADGRQSLRQSRGQEPGRGGRHQDDEGHRQVAHRSRRRPGRHVDGPRAPSPLHRLPKTAEADRHERG